MPDLHPTNGKLSALETSPPMATTAIYRRQPASFKQLGYAKAYNPVGDSFIHANKPNYYTLNVWDTARRKESLIRQALEYIIQTVVARVGNYSHPNPQIDDFVQANIDKKIRRWIRELLETALWSGFAVQEINWVSKIGPNGMPQTWIDDLIGFHPLQVYLIANDFGVIKDGDIVSNQPYKSGIWVPMPPTRINKPTGKADRVGSLVRLPKSKRVYVNYRGDGNNIYGRSLVEACIPWHMYKEAFREILFSALERYATPFIWVKVPPLDTKEMKSEPDGTLVPKTLHEVTQEQLQNLSSETALVFTQISKDQPVEIGALTTGNNFSDSFTNAIDLCDDNMRALIGIPNLIMKDKIHGLGSGNAAEIQIEKFNQLIEGIFDDIVSPFLEQAILQLIQYNFDARIFPEALHPGSIQIKPARSSDLKVLLDGIKDLGEQYELNKTESDEDYVRDLLGFPKHSRTEKKKPFQTNKVKKEKKESIEI